MNAEILTERLFQALVCGDRLAARRIIDECTAQNIPAETLAQELFWPVLDTVNTLFRNDQLTTLAQHYATRLLRLAYGI